MKKNFENNPAFEMLSGYTESEKSNTEIKHAKTETKKTAKKTFEPVRKENKSKKLLLLIKPTLFEKLQAKAKDFDLSTNELINQILESNI